MGITSLNICACISHNKSVYMPLKRNRLIIRELQNWGEVVEYGSMLHWIAYFLCEYNISSQKGGKPNAPICSFMELNNYFHMRNH